MKGRASTQEKREQEMADLRRKVAELSHIEADHRRAEETLLKLNECFLSLGPDPLENIELIVRTAGEILGGACVLYNRLDRERNLLCTCGIWNKPRGYKLEDRAEGHICCDVIKAGKGAPVIIEDLTGTKYEKTDPYVRKYKLKSYIGYPVCLKGEAVGSFCLCDVKRRKFTKQEIRIISMLAEAIAVEEERKRAEDEIKRAAEEWETTFNSTTSLISIQDRDYKVIRANKAYAEVLGMKPEEICGRACYELIHATDKPWPNCPHKRVLETGEPARAEFFEPRLGMHLEVAVSPIFNDEGEVAGSVHIVTDITGRKKAEEELKKYPHHLEKLVEERTAELKSLNEQLEERARRISRQQVAVLELSKEDLSHFDTALRKIVEVDAETLEVARVNVWLFNEDRTEIVCIGHYERSTGKHEKGMLLSVEAYPRYFKALEESRVIAAHDARTDPRTSEFADDYLPSFGITSMLDASIRLRGKTIGIICHEHVGPAREWILDEQDFAGSIGGMVALALEASEYKRAEMSLRESEQKYSSLINDAIDSLESGLFILDRDFAVIWVNRAVEKFFGVNRDDIIGKDKRKVIREKIKHIFEDPEKFEKTVLATYADNTYVENFTCHVLPAEGREERYLIHWSSPIMTGPHAGGRIEHYYDITERRRAEEQILVANERLQYLLSSTSAVIYASKVSGDYGATFMSENVAHVTGYEPREFLDSSGFWIDHIHPEDAQGVLAELPCILERGWHCYEYRFRHRSGEYIWMRDEMKLVRDEEGRPLEIIGYWINITERKRLEEELRHIQKMEAIGTLAGGIAHDFNNILAGILGYASLMKGGVLGNSPYVEDLEKIEKLSLRASDLTKALLAFSRKGMYRPEPLTINRIIEDVLKVVRRTAAKGITVKTGLLPEVSNIFCDEGQIHQVLMNLCINACEAMSDGGTLTITTANAKLDDEFFSFHPFLKKGPYVALTVSDTGIGMDAETRDRIFDPFFTTKAERSGTGLGLSMVSGIIERHGGCIEVESAPGRGSTFTLYLPATEEEERAVPPEPVATLDGDETILVIDDEESFRESVGRWFEQRGYTVHEASSGEEALKVLEDKKDAIDLVLLDMVMSGMSGAETFRRMRKMVPDLPVVICSGYPLVSSYEKLLKEGICDFIQKPFRHRSLGLKVRKALSSR